MSPIMLSLMVPIISEAQVHSMLFPRFLENPAWIWTIDIRLNYTNFLFENTCYLKGQSL